MSTIRRNVIANLAGKGWAVLLSLAVVPVYVRLLGMEAYGLIGIFMSLTAIFALLDLGLGNALNRQLATYSVQPGKERDMQDLLRTLEIIYWLIGIVVGVALAVLGPLIATYWLKSQQLTTDSVAQILMLMGVAVAAQWPRALYVGGLMGMQRQVALNVISAASATVLNIGGVLIVLLVSPTLQALIVWMIVVGCLDTLITRTVLLRKLPPTTSRPPVFSRQQLASVWRFAAGMTGISIVSVILGQMDKVILTKILTLEAFGYYSLAWRVAQGLYYLVAPVSAAFFPRFSQIAALGNDEELGRIYHRGCQLMSVIVLPVTILLALFPFEIMYLWTSNLMVASQSSTILAVLAVGTAVNGLMNLPLSLQLAFGWTRLVLLVNTAAVIVLCPLIYFVSMRYGGLGAAWVWLVLNCTYVVVLLRMMHRRLLPRQLRQWFLVDVGAPLGVALIVAYAWKFAVGMSGSYLQMLVSFGMVFLLTAFAAAVAAPQIRTLISSQLHN